MSRWITAPANHPHSFAALPTMTLQQILPLYKMDKEEFRSNRRYYEHTVPLDSAEPYLAELPVQIPYNEYNWTDALPDELQKALSVLPQSIKKKEYTMANAKQMPSGNWRVQVFLGTDKNGKKIKKSITARTRWEAEKLAAEYLDEIRTAQTRFCRNVNDR